MASIDHAQLLRAHGLRVTALRVELVGLLRDSDRALTQLDLEARITVPADRVSIFRSLGAFEQAGLVHRVVDANGTGRFAPCPGGCREGVHVDAHAHFHCVKCDGVFCLASVAVPHVVLPRGFRSERSLLEVEGVCKECR